MRLSVGMLCAYGWLVFLVLYVGAYAALMKPEGLILGHNVCVVVKYPAYRFCDSLVYPVFSPINQLDQVLRPRYWKDSYDPENKAHRQIAEEENRKLREDGEASELMMEDSPVSEVEDESLAAGQESPSST